MRILFLLKFPLYGGGSGSFTRRLSEKLAQKGYDVAVASVDRRAIEGVKIYTLQPAFKAVFEGHPEWKRPKHYAELTGFEFTRQYASFLKQIGRIVEDFKPDVIHVNHAHFLNWIASFVKSLYGIAFVTTVHGTGIYNCTLDRRYLVLTRQALERAEQVIAVSSHTRKWFLKVFGLKLKGKTRIVPNGIDTALYRQEALIKIIDKKYNLEGKKLIIFAGRLTREKGLEYLIRAGKRIKAEIFIIGDGPHKKFLVNYSKLVGAKNVRFLGYFGKEYLDELREFYRRADALVLPSVVDESTGLVVLEAMASWTPVVASKKGGIPTVVKDGYNGFLVRARSAKAIAVGVNKILKDEELRQKLGENARRTVFERFDWRVIAPQYEAVYQKAYEATKKLRDIKLKAYFEKQELEREKRELTEKIGYIT